MEKILVLMTLVLFITLQAGCEKEGTAEKAGKEVDKAFSAKKEKINDVTK